MSIPVIKYRHDLAYDGPRWCDWCSDIYLTKLVEFRNRIWRECPKNHKLTKAYKQKSVFNYE